MGLLVDENVHGKVFEPGFETDCALVEILRDFLMVSSVKFVEILVSTDFIDGDRDHAVQFYMGFN